jgi:surface antigen
MVRIAMWSGALTLALASGGCSFSYQLDSMFGKNDKPDATGALKPAAIAERPAELPPEADLVYARAAVSELLAKGGKTTSMPWENPSTGARGTVTPIASTYTENGMTCRDFLASYMFAGAESWLQGEACRFMQGRWEVRNIKPWQRT